MAIGPQIPEHLLNQLQHSNSKDTSDDSDNDDGPQPVASTSSIGPQLSATAAEAQKAETKVAADEDDSEDDAYVPALPPDLVRPSTKLSTTSTQRVGPSAPSRRVARPSLPSASSTSVPAVLAATSHIDENEDDDSDSDDGYGPMPLPEGTQRSDGISEGVREFMEREEKRRKEAEEAAKPKKAVRDEWMLVPPSSSDIMSHLSDPTKLKARQFSRSAAPAVRGAPNNLWTETPAERAQRVADEVAGRKRRAADIDGGSGGGVEPDSEDALRKRRRDEDMRRVVDKHNKSSRAQTLLDMHKDTAKANAEASASKDKDGPPGVWDHARDMSVGGRLMDDKQRGKLITDARALGDRFGSGKGGGYL